MGVAKYGDIAQLDVTDFLAGFIEYLMPVFHQLANAFGQRTHLLLGIAAIE
ncbi:hypothetical protein D3C73_1519720 [compost metagenome]